MILVVLYLHFEREILFQVLDHQNDVGQFDAKSVRGIHWTRDVSLCHVLPVHLDHRRLDLRIRHALKCDLTMMTADIK